MSAFLVETLTLVDIWVHGMLQVSVDVIPYSEVYQGVPWRALVLLAPEAQ